MKKLLSILVLSFLFSGSANADYYVTGRIKGGETKLLGFGISIVNVEGYHPYRMYTMNKK